MFPKKTLTLAIGFISTAWICAYASTTSAAPVKVDINANVKHSVNGVSNFGRERRITIHANSIENDFLGEKEKLDYLMELGVYFGRDTGLSMFYFGQTSGDPSKSTPAGQGEPFPYGHADVHDSESLKRGADLYYENLETKYIDAQEYFNRDTAMIMGSQPRPAYPNWSSYSWFGGGLTSDNPWRPRTMQQTADWTAEFLEEFFLRREGEPNVPRMPQYWEVVNEPDMQMNTTGPEGHVSTWEELFRYHNVVADTIRAKLGNKAPKIGGMTWGLHDFHRGDATAFGAPRMQGDRLLNAFYSDDAGSQQIKNTVSNGIFAESDTMNDADTSRDWYQWDVIWKGFLDTAGKNMDFYSIHLYDWPLWQTNGGNIRTGTHSEGVMDLLEWYGMKILGQRKEVIVSEYGSVTGKYQEEGTTIDRIRMRWEKLKPFSQMMMQFMERPDYITSSLPFITVKAEWGDLGLTQPYSQTLLDRDYSSCDIEGEGDAQRYVNCTWNFNPAIHWYELWRDVEGTRVDTYSTDRDIQVDAYVNNENGEHHMYVIINSIEPTDTEIDLSFAGISGNPISNITMRHLYLDEAIDADNNAGNGTGKPIMAEATLAALPDSVVVSADSTIILDIEYANSLNTPLTNEEKKYPAEPLNNVSPYRVSVPATINAQVNNVPKPSNGEAQVRITGAFFINGQLETDSSDSRVFLQVNGNNVEFDTDWRGEEKGQNRQMATLEIPFPAEYLANNGNNTISFSTLANGQVAAVALQVWDMDAQIQRSIEGDCSPCTGVSNFNIAQGSVNLKVTSSLALNAQITPASASNKRVNWTSSNPSVASVDQNGIVTGTGVGTTTITGVAADGGASDQTTVRVTQLSPTSVSIVGVPPVLYIGGEKQLSAAVRPIHAPNRQVTWSSSNPGVATVSSTGVVSGVGSGSTTISVRTVDGGLTASTTLNVDSLGVTGFSISPNSTLLPVGDTFQLNTTFVPANASDQSITWTSSNNSVATVADGVVRGLSSGSVTITGRANDGGITDSSTIQVVNASATPFFIEAENFNDTGGPFAGFAIDAAKGHINDNQTGDWAEYEVTFAGAGTYQFILDAGVPAAGVGVAISLNGQEVARGSLAATGDWDAIERMVVTNNLPVATAGTYTVRLTSTGPAGQWVWNADKFGFRQLTGNIITPSSSQSSVSSSSAPVSSSSSNPVSSSSVSSSSAPSSSSSAVQQSSSSAPTGDSIRVELENFVDTGKDGAATAADTFDGFNAAGPIINFNTTGDWADYAITIPQSGRYKIDIHAASPTTGDIGVQLLLNGQEIAASSLSSTGDWGNFETFEIDNSVNLDAGSYTLRVQSQGSATWQWNGNYVDFTLIEQTSTSQSSSSPVNSNVMVELENFDDTGKATGPIGGDTVVGFNPTSNGVNFNTRGDWADYTVTFANSGTYRAIIEAGSPITGDIGVTLMLNGQEIASSSLSSTGDWDNYMPFEVGSNIAINAGTYTLRVQSQGNEIWQWNADKIRFEQ